MVTLPEKFIEQIRMLGLHPTDAERLLDSLSNSNPSVSLRRNVRKPWLPQHCGKPVPWRAESARYLSERPRFTLMPQLHQGRFYVQDASSMFIGAVIEQILKREDCSAPLLYLDACAAPGGKTTVAIDTLPEKSFVVANEYDSRRASVLVENIIKWGSPDVAVTKGDTIRLAQLGSVFDIIAVDAPCSGEGMFRKEEEAVSQWSPRLVEECACMQREILSNVWNALKPGGYLIYSTCTFNRSENEDNLRWLVDEFGGEPFAIETDSAWNVLESPLQGSLPCYRFLPGVIEGEGLFMGIVRKPGDSFGKSDSEKRKENGKKRNSKDDFASDSLKKWLNAGDEYVYRRDEDNRIWAMRSNRGDFVKLLFQKAKVELAGLALAVQKGKDLIPEHQLAMSLALSPDAFPKAELTLNQALAYLRRDVVELPEETPKGYVLACYDGYPLGFLKNLGNRSNNLYPQNWRILTRH